MPLSVDQPFWIGDRYFSETDIALLQTTIREFPQLSRSELVATLCENLPWKSLHGKPRREACHNLLDALEGTPGLVIPPKRQGGTFPRPEHQGTPVPNLILNAPLAAIRPIAVVPVCSTDRLQWNATMAAYHPLGFQRACGARQAYWVCSMATGTPRYLGGMLFASAAKALQARDRWIGWDATTRARFRARIVNQSRFLILPGVHVPHLASHALSLVARRIRADWQIRYGFAPVLLETFVELPAAGTSYAAANWIHVGETVGRGRQDRHKTMQLPRKTIWLYPLLRHWRRALTAPWPQWSETEEMDDA